MWEKFKSIIAHEQIFASILIILVGVISFGLGRISVTDLIVSSSVTSIELAPEPFIIDVAQAGAVAGASSAALMPDAALEIMSLVASKTGSRYHLLDCPSAKQIKDSNKVYFTSAQEAEAAGYTKAANCPGL